MRPSQTVLVLMATIVLAFAGPGTVAVAGSSDFRGEVARGDTLLHGFEHDGQQYEFRLLPTSTGWIIWIGDPAHRDRNLVAAATLSTEEGLNPAVIEGWHFRNKANTGPNTPGPKGVDAPQRSRTFAFVLNSADFIRARQAIEVLRWRQSLPADQVKAARESLQTMPIARGVLRIEALELSNFVEGSRAVIERMAFSVRIEWPPHSG